MCVCVCVFFLHSCCCFYGFFYILFYFLSVALSFFLCLYFIVVVYISSKYFFELQYSVKEIDAKLNDYLSKYILIYQLQHNTNRFRNIRLENKERNIFNIKMVLLLYWLSEGLNSCCWNCLCKAFGFNGRCSFLHIWKRKKWKTVEKKEIQNYNKTG